MPDVQLTAVIPVYNRPGPLRVAVASVLDQRHRVDEVIVVDDGSTDDVTGAVTGMDDRVRVVVHPRNRGAPAARNTGVAAARGRWVAFLDSDDVWCVDKLARQIPVMAAGAPSSVTGFVHRRADAEEHVVLPAGGVTFERMLRGCHVAPGATWVVERRRFEELGGFDEGMPRLEDWDLLLRDCQAGPMAVVRAACAVVNAHQGPPRDVVEASLRTIADRWLPRLDQRRHRRLLQAGLLMESAAAAYRGGDRTGTLARTAAAALLDPWQGVDAMRRARRRRADTPTG